MIDGRAKVLNTVTSALKSGVIEPVDLQKILESHIADKNTTTSKISSNRLSAVDVMFYIAGIVLFAAIVALIAQSWEVGPSVRIMLSAGVGVLFWAVALYLIQLSSEDDIRRGITHSLLLTGSLSLITGGFIIANEYADFDDPNFYAAAITLVLLGTLHIGFGWQIKRYPLLLIGILLAVASFPVFVFGLLDGSNMPMFIYCLIIATSGGLLTYAARVVSWAGTSTKPFGHIFDPLGAFVILISLYAASYDETTGLLWLLVLIVGIVGLFYLSIVTQNKYLLGSSSFFLVLAIVTISYRYFSDNPAFSLLISAAGLLGTAIMAANINRRYIRSS